jgi:hypothetical protein
MSVASPSDDSGIGRYSAEFQDLPLSRPTTTLDPLSPGTSLSSAADGIADTGSDVPIDGRDEGGDPGNVPDSSNVTFTADSLSSKSASTSVATTARARLREDGPLVLGVVVVDFNHLVRLYFPGQPCTVGELCSACGPRPAVCHHC